MLTAAEKENEAKETTPKFINRTANTISFNISRSPPQGNNSPMTTPTCSPVSSPVNSPITAGTKAPYSSPNKSPTVAEVQTKKVRFCQWNYLRIIEMYTSSGTNLVANHYKFVIYDNRWISINVLNFHSYFFIFSLGWLVWLIMTMTLMRRSRKKIRLQQKELAHHAIHSSSANAFRLSGTERTTK